jgi:hypothetical protein
MRDACSRTLDLRYRRADIAEATTNLRFAHLYSGDGLLTSALRPVLVSPAKSPALMRYD